MISLFRKFNWNLGARESGIWGARDFWSDSPNLLA